MQMLSSTLTDLLFNYGMISEEEKPLYKYGFTIGLEEIVTILSILLISMRMDMILEACGFFLLFLSIKRYSGGFHCPKFYQCFICSNIMSTVFLYSLKYVHINTFQIFILTTAAASILIKTSPIEHYNKPLDSEEIRYFKLKLNQMVCLVVILQGIALILAMRHLNILISFVLTITAFDVVLAKIAKRKWSVR